MKKSIFIKSLSMIFAFLVVSHFAMAQDQEKASPARTAEGTVDGANIQIGYGSPAVRDRNIWGGLVPYDQVWRSGANEATTFTTDQAIKVEGKELAAGKYALFTIPGQNEWTIIFNKEASQWGSTKYQESEDVLRVKVTPKESSEMNERLTYDITADGFVLKWEKVEVPVKITKN
ncbi:DUF2911 domain-containing protein [Litoribacter alkaliphilus]|uniref:DUF2911 domain-containing protein n=1 Tax=Litoribacter ruber TaxID=702568 RepID=A0AAP2G510_9BACT|nr:DUF2911 domain-containing protein [Litoribacter alkaliphilus]MBS9524601.1 DUF2911 domain-containing protein [Litoribacter alkaliphilus]